MDSKTIVLNAWKTFGSGDAVLIAQQFTQDADWLAPQGNATAVALGCTNHMVGADEIAQFVAHRFPSLFLDVEIDMQRVIDCGSTVVIQEKMTAGLANGRRYEVEYCFVFDVRDGRVRAVQEYMDTLRGWRDIFGDQATGCVTTDSI